MLDYDEAQSLLSQDPAHAEILRPYMTGRDLAHRDRAQFIIDFDLRSEGEARTFPVLYDIVRSRVKPQRDNTSRKSMRERWWLFGEPRSTFRPALEGLKAYIGTVETAKHRIFTFLPVALATSHKIICIASDDPFHLGVLSSAIHQAWALATGGRLGVGNDPVYTKSKCFDPFPFPEPDSDRRQRIAALAKQLDAHRKAALERDRAVTMTGMYNVVEKLRSREPLAPNERKVHEVAACGVLRDFHDELDRLVAEAYGWPWPLNREETLGRLVALHGERVQEERAGIVRWLRPEYQAPGATAPAPTKRRRKKTDPAQIEFELPTEWPDEVAEQIEAVRMLASHRPITAAEAAAHFGVKDKRIIQHQLELLLLRGEASVVKQPKRSKRKAARRFVCGLVPQPAGALPGPSFDSGRWPEKRKRTTR